LAQTYGVIRDRTFENGPNLAANGVVLALHNAVTTRKTNLTETDEGGAMNTAQLRSLAYEAMGNGEWDKAASLYDRAADVYPTATGALARADIKGLRERAASCRDKATGDVPFMATFTCGCGQKVQMFLRKDSPRQCLDCRDAADRAQNGWTPENSCD